MVFKWIKERHGSDFADFEAFDWDTALTVESDRVAYGETRIVSIGRIDACVFVGVWVLQGTHTRLISLRKANRREVRRYEQS